MWRHKKEYAVVAYQAGSGGHDCVKSARSIKLYLGLVSVLFLLSACTEGFVRFPVTEKSQENVSQDVTIIRLDASNIASFSSPSHVARATTLPNGRGWEYRVGVGDVLNIIVFDHPELTLPAGPQRSAEESGFLVQADGSFFYPFIGQVTARARSVADIRAEVTTRLAAFIPDPQVVVRIAAFNSQNVVVTGEVAAPSRQALTTTPLTLVEAVNAVGGLKDTADARRVTVQRGGTLYNVDLDGFLSAGIRQNNPVLRSGDIVSVPRRKAEEAFILGQVQKPAAVDLSVEPVTLTQALTRQGGLDELRADARGVFVFRADGARMTVFQLETSSPVGLLLGTRFILEPRDVVYITRSPLQRWNDTINGLLPSVRGASVVEALGN
jgi:polysaccharide biosynthesis/export protein